VCVCVRARASNRNSMPDSNRGSVSSTATNAQARWAITLYDFVGSSEQRTLTIFTGDVLKIKEVTESQWWLAECGGRAGFVPRSYVQLKDEKWTPNLGGKGVPRPIGRDVAALCTAQDAGNGRRSGHVQFHQVGLATHAL